MNLKSHSTNILEYREHSLLELKDVTNNLTKEESNVMANYGTKEETSNVTKEVTNDVTNNLTSNVTKEVAKEVKKDVTNNVTKEGTSNSSEFEGRDGGEVRKRRRRLSLLERRRRRRGMSSGNVVQVSISTTHRYDDYAKKLGRSTKTTHYLNLYKWSSFL